MGAFSDWHLTDEQAFDLILESLCPLTDDDLESIKRVRECVMREIAK